MPIAAQDVYLNSDDGVGAKNAGQIQAIRQHVDDLLQGPAFKGSHRSQQFLRYIVERALRGEVEGLKERTIGVELFQRSPTYDTGQDAIVRVTASDVRKRLLHHYGRYGDASQFHISIPPGSYLPEIEVQSATAAKEEPKEALAGMIEVSQPAETTSRENLRSARRGLGRWIWAASGVVVGMLIAAVLLQLPRWLGQKPISTLPPWAAIFRPAHATQIITSDPNVEKLQELIGYNISVSEYANRHYVPDGKELSPEEQQFYLYYQHADNAAAVDTPLAVSIARLAPEDFPVGIRSARSLRVTDLANDDNLVLIGSPRSNPWVELVEDQLDFRFVFHPEMGQEIVENVHPRSGEQRSYLPTALGFATGDSYALVAMVHNPNHPGQVLLLAGANAEGTEAAGREVTDRDHLLRLSQYCGIPVSGPTPEFELLLQVRTLAGSPSTVDLLACHLLTGPKSR